MDDFLLDENGILEHVDEYTLYCHYLNMMPDIGMMYNSPIRLDDNTPSFAIFPSRFIPGREYAWKDQGGGGYSGEIFKLIQMILKLRWGSCSRAQMLAHVRSEFGLGPQYDDNPRIIQQYTPKPREIMQIRVKSRSFDAADLRYWRQFNISAEILTTYNVKPISCYWTYESQSTPRFPRGLGYSYRIRDKYKLYFPQDSKEFKFRNTLTEKELEGFEQLKFDQDLLIITKSLKDVMCLRSFGYESVAPRGESILVPDEYLRFLEQRYKKIVLLFDNDGKHKADSYKYPKIFVPVHSGEKDISDYCKRYGPEAAADLIKHLLWGL